MPTEDRPTAPCTDAFWEPEQGLTTEEKIKRSLFIAHLQPCRSNEDVRMRLGEISALHKSATHNCWAYCLENGSEHSSDDGEPSGTAGKPILAAIKRSGMINLLVVVTRYYGGIKLGVRGLIEAYGLLAERAVLQASRVTRIRSRQLTISLPYSSIGDITHCLNHHGVIGAPEWSYEADVHVIAFVPISSTIILASTLRELHSRKLIHSWHWLT